MPDPTTSEGLETVAWRFRVPGDRLWAYADGIAFDASLEGLEMRALVDKSDADQAIRALEAKLAAAVEALERIERWFGEFPPSGRFWDEGDGRREMSYGVAFGSNGERDFMRAVARQTLATIADGGGE